MLGARVPLLDSHAASNQPHRRHACMDASIMRALSSNMEFCGINFNFSGADSVVSTILLFIFFARVCIYIDTCSSGAVKLKFHDDEKHFRY